MAFVRRVVDGGGGEDGIRYVCIEVESYGG